MDDLGDFENKLPRVVGGKKCTEHANKKIRPSKRLELYIFLVLGPEIAAPTLWTPGISGSFFWKTSMPKKILVLGGGGYLGFFGRGGGVSVNFIFYGRGEFSEKCCGNAHVLHKAIALVSGSLLNTQGCQYSTLSVENKMRHLHVLPWGRLHYSCNSEIIKSISVSVIET